MALRGNLRDFSLPDVFQLVTFSRKTGVLRITREGGVEGSVWFRDGDVFFASSNWHTELLGERLVRAQRITPQALKRALQLRADEPEQGRRLGQILVDEGYITDSVLEAFVQEQIQDTIFDLMRWDEGEFDFEAMPDVVNEDIGLLISIENIVMEGSRRLEEWNRIRKKIPSMEIVFKMATAPGEGTFEISLKPTEWQLLLLIDSTRSVSELASATGRTDFEVARVLYGLFSAGLLEFASDEEIEHNRAERLAREAKLAVLEAERRQAEKAGEVAALEHEAALTGGAERRDETSAQVELGTPAAAAVADGVAAVPSAPAEVPTFLGAGAAEPTEDDQAALEEFMGALLGHTETEPVLPQEPEAPLLPYVPAEEPAFMHTEAPPEVEDEARVAIEDLLGMVPRPVEEIVVPAEPEPILAEPQPVEAQVEPPIEIQVGPPIEFEIEQVIELEVETPVELEIVPPTEEVAETPVELEIVPPTEEVAETPAPSVPAEEPLEAEEVEAPDFERDLMALGLGELPSDLLEPVDIETVLSAEAPEAVLEGLAAPAEPMSVEVHPEEAVVEWIEESVVPEAPGAPPQPHAEEPVAGELEFELEAEPESEIEYVEVLEEGEVEVQELSAEDTDFSALIESLDVDADDLTDLGPAPVELAPSERGFDEELLRDETPAESGKVISTDAFLSDITMDDLGFSGGLTDELSALTGAKRRAPARPQANVNRLPAEGSAVLKRDVRVDKDTLLKIIDGIKNL